MPLGARDAQRARVAMQRFGLGPKPGGLARVGDDALQALKDELDAPKIAAIERGSLPTYATATRVSQGDFSEVEAVRERELRARIGKQLSVDIGFVERLVMFWSNHFSMSINKDGVIRGTYGQLERDVIRKHVLGKFSDMHLGVMRHPAMLRYLDNQDSIGPNSEIGKSWGAGYNENLGRELLELHTLGAGGGYSEQDVTAMALLLTGWSYVRWWEIGQDWADVPDDRPGQFFFREEWHEPGAISFMGEKYAPEGQKQAEKAIRDIARKRATAEHIAFKLVRHFITDEPTRAMVEPVADAFHKSKGDLKKTALALIGLPEAFDAPLTKIRTPYELSIAQLRALGAGYPKDATWLFYEPLRAMDNLPWERPAPDGYPDESWAWLDPDGMTIRLDTAMLAVDAYAEDFTKSAFELGKSLYGASLSDTTSDALMWTTDKRAGLTLLFMSPEFQRR